MMAPGAFSAYTGVVAALPPASPLEGMLPTWKDEQDAVYAYLGGTSYEAPPKHDTASFDKLHVWYFADAPKQAQPEQPAGERTATFDEVVGGLDEAAAVYEAKRCLSCGNCFECDGCLGACPEDAVIKLGTGNRYRFDYDLCTGCGACFEQCPVHAIDMVRDVL